MLILSTAPALASLWVWWFLGETLSAGQFVGILVTLGGVAWMVRSREGEAGWRGPDRRYVLGILCGLGAAAGQVGVSSWPSRARRTPSPLSRSPWCA